MTKTTTNETCVITSQDRENPHCWHFELQIDGELGYGIVSADRIELDSIVTEDFAQRLKELAPEIVFGFHIWHDCLRVALPYDQWRFRCLISIAGEYRHLMPTYSMEVRHGA